MRIYSPFRDYYDVGASWDQEPTPVYHRTTEQLVIKRQPQTTPRRFSVVDQPRHPLNDVITDLGQQFSSFYDEFDEVDTFVIGFCGQLYPGWRWRKEVCYDPIKLTNQLVKTAPPNKGSTYQWMHTPNDPTRLTTSLARDLTADQFRTIGTPIFLLDQIGAQARRFRLVLNPPLHTLRFQTVFDPARAWQAIDLYLSNDLAKQIDPPDQISDTLRRDNHGFDERSFKKGPGGPTRKRKKAARKAAAAARAKKGK